MRKLTNLFGYGLIAITLIVSQAQALQSTNQKEQSILKLTKAQMLEDFDLLIKHINTFAVHKDLNAKRLSIDYEEHYSRLRKEISQKTDYCQFHEILEKAINLVQDQHSSFMSYDYLSQYGQYQSKLNIEDDDSYDAIKSYEVNCKVVSKPLKLPIMYQEGKYLIYADFNYQGQSFKRGLELVKYNQVSIESYITNNMDTIWPVKLDQQLNKAYNPHFYSYGENQFLLTFSDGRRSSFNLNDTVSYIRKHQRDVYYTSQKQEQLHYFEQQGILYIGLPMMDMSYAESLIQKINKLVESEKTFSKVIIDIRGNPGGNDMTWRALVTHLFKKKFNLAIVPKFKYESSVVERYGKQNSNVIAEAIPLLDKKKYWTKEFDIMELEINPSSIDFKGQAYILQDAYIYSSAGNFSNFALSNNEFISVGDTTDLVGGAQVEPLFYRLKNSEFVFRVEPMLDFTNVNKLSDFSHNEVDVKIRPTIEDYYLRTTYEGDIYGKEFLLKHDRLFHYVMEQ